MKSENVPTTRPLTNAIEFSHVSISFASQVLLDDISFSVSQGSMCILIGPSNCGKSTLIKLAIGLLKPDRGQIMLAQEDISNLSEDELFALRDQIGVVLQTDALFSMSVADNVAYRLPHLGWKPEEIEAEIRRVLHIVDLDAAYDLMPEELSGGMSRRAAIARAMAGSPKIMFYDSPCSGLDPITSRRLMREIIRQRDIERVSSIYVTQNLDEVKYLCSHLYELEANKQLVLRRESEDFCLVNARVMMISEGRIIFDREDEFLWESKDEAIRQFLD